MNERWITFLTRLETILVPDQLLGWITPLKLQQAFKELIDLILYSRFGIDEQTFKVVLRVQDNAGLASNEGLVFDFAGLVRVERNGRSVNVWRGTGPVTDFDAYFTVGNSTRPRPNGQTKKGDRLRWNALVAGPLLGTDLLKVSAVTSLAGGGEATSSGGYEVATDEQALSELANGPYAKFILWDKGVGKVIIYAYTPRLGLREFLTYDPTTPRI